MNIDILKKLKTESLVQLREQVEIEYRSRFDFKLQKGRIATFTDSSNAIKREIEILTIGPKNVIGVETHNSADEGRKWRVSKAQLQVVGIPLETPIISKPKIKAEPIDQVYNIDVW